MLEVVVAEQAFLAAAVLDSRDHRRVIELVREDDAPREELAERRQGGLVRHIAAGEQERALFTVEARQLSLELGVIMRIAADIAGTPGSRADVAKREFHRRDDGGVLAHR